MEEVTPNNMDEIICTKIGEYCDSDEEGDSEQHSEL